MAQQGNLLAGTPAVAVAGAVDVEVAVVVIAREHNSRPPTEEVPVAGNPGTRNPEAVVVSAVGSSREASNPEARSPSGPV